MVPAVFSFFMWRIDGMRTMVILMALIGILGVTGCVMWNVFEDAMLQCDVRYAKRPAPDMLVFAFGSLILVSMFLGIPMGL